MNSDMYVVFITNDKRQEVYWTGTLLEHNAPDITDDVRLAKRFCSAREAYKQAGQHKKLQRFNVGRRPWR